MNSVFIDNDKPELIFDATNTNQTQQTEPECDCCYKRHDVTVNMPHTDNPIPGPFVPDYCVGDIYDNNPNTVPTTYLAPGHKCCGHGHPPDRNICPMSYNHCKDSCFVTKYELNHVLRHIADADIFIDESENGTTTSVGGIKKGTKFEDKTTLVSLINDMLYSDNIADQEYACESPSGEELLNSTVKYPIGGLQVGDSLKGMTISQILESMLCGKKEEPTPPPNE